jgi:hypothetical protein
MENKLIKLPDTERSVGTSLKGSFRGYKFIEIYAAFGAPSYDNYDPESIFNKELSEDKKVQVEWDFKFNGAIFTVYDWKTYDRLYTLSENEVWNVGGKTNASDFIDHIIYFLNQNRN